MSGSKRGIQVRCLHTFKRRQRDELSFSNGEVLSILRQDDGDWWLAQNASFKKGLIPMNLVEFIRSDTLPALEQSPANTHHRDSAVLMESSSLPQIRRKDMNPSHSVDSSNSRIINRRISGIAQNEQRTSPPSKIPTLRKKHQKANPVAAHSQTVPTTSMNFDNKISKDPSNPFLPEAGRYELIVCYGCPFAARPWLCLNLLGLQDSIRVVRTYPANVSDGWFFQPVSKEERAMVEEHAEVEWERDGPTCGSKITHLKELYLKTNPNFNNTVTLPVLFDAKTQTIVSNSSLDISDMICTQFDPSLRRDGRVCRKGPARVNLVLMPSPQTSPDHAETITLLDSKVSMAVYKIHMAKTQMEYESNVVSFFSILDGIEKQLSRQQFLMGDKLTFSDLLLFITVVRMPLVYEKLFRVDLKRVDQTMYPHIWRHTQYILKMDGVGSTLHSKSIKLMYYLSRWMAEGAGRTIPMGPSEFELPPLNGIN